MAQVTYIPGQHAETTGEAGSLQVQLPTIPAGGTGVINLVVDRNVSVSAPGLTVQISDDVGGGTHRVYQLERGPGASELVTMTFSAACIAAADSYGSTGIVHSRIRNTSGQSTGTNSPVPELTLPSLAEGMLTAFLAPASYPRLGGTDGSNAIGDGMTRQVAKWGYTAAGGWGITIASKNAGAGNVSTGNWAVYTPVESLSPGQDPSPYEAYRFFATTFIPSASAPVGDTPASFEAQADFVGAPINPTLASNGHDTVSITWSSGDPLTLGYETKLQKVGEAEQAIVNTTVGQRVLTGLTPTTPYVLFIRATKGAEQSSWTPFPFTTTAIPVTVVPISVFVAQQLSLSGKVGDSVQLSYLVAKGTGGGVLGSTPQQGAQVQIGVSNESVGKPTYYTATTDVDGRAQFTLTLGPSLGTAVINATATHLAAGATAPTVLQAPTVSLTTGGTGGIAGDTIDSDLDFSNDIIPGVPMWQDPRYVDVLETYTFDFSDQLAIGETIVDQSPPVEVKVRGDATADPNPNAQVYGDSTLIDGAYVTQRLYGGIKGTSYHMRCKARTSLGREVSSEIRFRTFGVPL